MELLQGEVLSDRLKRAEPLAVPEALRILRDAASGVDAGHRAGLIHRDIKPGNIFLSHPEHGGPARVSVLDFGIARFTEAQETTQLTHSGRGFLSPAYASPEQLRGERPITPASDVFSLGVIGYHLLAREKPFRHDRMHPGPYARPPVPLRERNPAVPAAVAAVIEQAMRDDPAARFADAGAFVRALVEAESAPEEQGSAAAGAVTVSDATQLQPPAPVANAGSAAAQPSDVRADAAPAADPPVDEKQGDGRVAADFATPPVYAAAAPVVAAAAAEPPPVHPPVAVDDTRREPAAAAAPHRATAVRPARKMNPALLGIPLLVVIAIALWLVMGRGKTERVAASSASTQREARPTGAAGPVPATTGGATDGQSATGQTGIGGDQGTGNPPGAAVPGAAGSPSAPSTGRIAPAPAVAPPAAASPAARPPVVEPVPAAASAGGAGATALNREGEALFERGDLAGAIGRFRAAVRAAPGNAYYRNNLGWALFQSGSVEEAGRELNEAVRLDPRRDIAYANIGEVERARGNTAAAIAAYERFLQLNTDPRRERIAREKLRTLRGG
jgi:hypothetical protein